MYCSVCGKEINDNAVICTGCGCSVKRPASQDEAKKESTKTSASLILGIAGIIFAWFFALVGHILSVTGIILGIKEYKTTEKMTGLVLSIIGEVCSIFSSIIGAVAFSGIL